MTKNLHQGHRERLKNRFLSEGLLTFESHEILEMLLFYSIPRKDTNEIGHELIMTFGSLFGVLNAPVDELEKVNGISKNSAIMLAFVGQIIREYYSDKFRDDIILDSTEKMGEYIRHWFISEYNEKVLLVCMDNKCKVLNTSFVSEGSMNATEIHIRRILEQAIRNRATAVVISHNHPSGFALPSLEDQVSTKRITDTLNIVGVELVDHLIFAEGDYVSMRSTPTMRHLFRPTSLYNSHATQIDDFNSASMKNQKKNSMADGTKNRK